MADQEGMRKGKRRSSFISTFQSKAVGSGFALVDTSAVSSWRRESPVAHALVPLPVHPEPDEKLDLAEHFSTPT